MTINKQLDDYINAVNADQKDAFIKLRMIIKESLPQGFEEVMNNGMIGYVVPLSIYEKGYRGKEKEPLPFIHLASQKNHIAIYHMGLYANQTLLNWFLAEYSKKTNGKLDIGKSCIRFKKFDQIPFDIIGELCTRMTPQEWVYLYEKIIL